MLMGINQILDRLVGHQLSGFVYHRQRARFVQRRLNHHQIRRIFHQNAVVAPPRKEPDAISKFLSRYFYRR